MAKRGMNIRYRSRKRERNKYNPSVNETGTKNVLMTFLYVIIFLGLMGLMTFGMYKMGVFERGYVAPEKEEAKVDYTKIPIGTVFNRDEKEYYVLFDNYKNSITSDNYVNELLKDSKIRVYKVDMSRNDNAKYAGETANKKATNASELSINDITLIKINNGRISLYLTGSEEIEKYLSK